MPLQELLYSRSLLLPFGVFRQFFVSSKDENARPIIAIPYYVQLDIYERVGAHPIHFLLWRRKAVQEGLVIQEINGGTM
jgi:hypothetical protein